MVQHLKMDGKSDWQRTGWVKGGPLSFLSMVTGLKAAMRFACGTSIGMLGGGATIGMPGLYRTQ